jgi:hypothetical protein
MMKTILWSKSVPRVELDQRSRAARLRLERIDRLLLPPAAVTQSRLRRLLGLYSAGKYRGAPQEGRTRGPLSDRWPPRMSTILAVWLLERALP